MAAFDFSPDAVFGSKPTVPKIPVLDPEAEQSKAIAGNIAAAPEASKLAGLTQDQIMKMLSQVDPNFSAQSKDITGNIEAMLRGEIPQDVSDAVARSAAGKSLVGGYGGSEMSRNLTARDLGLTSLDLTAKGLSSAESWLSATERLLSPAMATYTGMFITPQQQYSMDNEQNTQQFQRNWMKAQVDAMPDPTSPVYNIMKFCGREGGNPSSQGVSSNGGGGTNDWSHGWETAGGFEGTMPAGGYGTVEGAGAGTGEGAAATDMSTFM